MRIWIQYNLLYFDETINCFINAWKHFKVKHVQWNLYVDQVIGKSGQLLQVVNIL